MVNVSILNFGSTAGSIKFTLGYFGASPPSRRVEDGEATSRNVTSCSTFAFFCSVVYLLFSEAAHSSKLLFSPLSILRKRKKHGLL